MSEIFINSNSKSWAILEFFLSCLLVGVLLAGCFYLIAKITPNESEDNKKSNFAIYILRSLLCVFLIVGFSAIFGYQTVVLGILLVIFIFLLSFYSIPTGISRMKDWQLEKNNTIHLEMIAITKERAEKSGELKKNITALISSKYGNVITNKVMPRISIIERVKGEQEEKELVLLYIEVWIKKSNKSHLNRNFIEEFISESIEIVPIDKYREHKFHVEQSGQNI